MNDDEMELHQDRWDRWMNTVPWRFDGRLRHVVTFPGTRTWCGRKVSSLTATQGDEVCAKCATAHVADNGYHGTFGRWLRIR
jgi:hypothetical protein